ncbi:MAG: response regulator transcription factor [Lachnospiraceae bacterium]|nr:response regulator transcription factor [Lachnospiraceae bacterium]
MRLAISLACKGEIAERIIIMGGYIMVNNLRIGICDDEEVVHRIMKQFIYTYSKEKSVAVDVISYTSGISLTDSIDVFNLDVLFLDIDMPRLDGIETAHRLNETKMSGRIIMLTSKLERFKEAFEIGAFRFVTKPIEQQEVFKVLDAVRSRMVGNKEVTVFRDGIAYTIVQKEILYIMSDKHSSYVFTEKYDFRSEKSMTWWEKELDDNMFFRCHKSYIVNLGRIKEMDKKIHLITGEYIDISRRKKSELLQRFMEYDTKYR